MIYLRLVWWVFWRGLLYGGIAGILTGTIFAAFAGTTYGVLIGTVMGAVLGLLNGLSLAGMTRFLFAKPPVDRSRYIDCTRLLTIPIDVVVALAYGLPTFGLFGVIPALLIAIAAFALSPAFADYAIYQLKHNSSYNIAKGTS
jgi:hypothetical protein